MKDESACMTSRADFCGPSGKALNSESPLRIKFKLIALASRSFP